MIKMRLVMNSIIYYSAHLFTAIDDVYLDSTYLTRVNVLKFANLFQSRNKIKLRHLCKFIKIIFFKNTSSWLVTSLSFVVFLLCYIHPLVMCVQILILHVCIYLCTIVMHWFMRIQNLDLDWNVLLVRIIYTMREKTKIYVSM